MAANRTISNIIAAANSLAEDLAEFSSSKNTQISPNSLRLEPKLQVTTKSQFDLRITDDDLIDSSKSRFESGHYADSVEAAIKRLNDIVRDKSGSTLDGDKLMSNVFAPSQPKLRINRLRSDSEVNEQRGHMQLCQGVVAGWRNPRAHSSRVKDEPDKALMMLELIQHLVVVTKGATRTRSRKP